jgi:glyoxylase-like metal-dependent hydrolase (beta-lactamase superfamily II)
VKVHHLNCGTMNMPTAPLVCHVLLVETDNGLVLVDSGFGSHDRLNPAKRVGPTRHVVRPLFDHIETAAHQVERLGFRRDDVRHIVITHLDVDHIGGLSDFPDAQIHCTVAEALGAIRSPTWREKLRYRPAQWAHKPNIVEHHPHGEKWRGFGAGRVRAPTPPCRRSPAQPGSGAPQPLRRTAPRHGRRARRRRRRSPLTAARSTVGACRDRPTAQACSSR